MKGVPVPPPEETASEESKPEGLFHLFHLEWPKVKQAPRSFIVCVVLVAVVLTSGAYWLIDHLYTAQIAGLTATIGAKDAQISSLTGQLTEANNKYESLSRSSQPANVLEQQQEIARLRDQVARLRERADRDLETEWPPLTQDQIEEWVRILGPHKIGSITVYWIQSVNAHRFYLSLQEVGRRLKVPVTSGGGGYPDGPSIDVLAFKAQTGAPKIVELLTALGYLSNLSLMDAEGNTAHAGASVRERANIDIFMPERKKP